MQTFCVLPWYSLELPDNRPCCWMDKNSDVDQVKKDLLNGVKTAACAECWQLEDNGKLSRRQMENTFLDHKLNRDLNLIEQDCRDNNTESLLYQITTSNLCNQACVSCNSKASTKWAEIELRMEMTPWYNIETAQESWKTYPYTFTNLSDYNINYQRARRINLLGGEPFFDSTTFKILEKLVENNNTDCFISIVTNGSVNLTDKQIALLEKFTDLNICLSIDGIGPVFEYMRWPGKWDQLLINIEQYRKFAKDISVSYTISALNVYYYNETIEWFNNNNLNYNHNIVSYPNWLALSRTPTILRNNDFVNSFCTENIEPDNLVKNILNQDHAKKIQIQTYMPEVAKLLGIN